MSSSGRRDPDLTCVVFAIYHTSQPGFHATGADGAKVRHAGKTLGSQPKVRKGVCACYGADVVAKVKKALG